MTSLFYIYRLVIFFLNVINKQANKQINKNSTDTWYCINMFSLVFTKLRRTKTSVRPTQTFGKIYKIFINIFCFFYGNKFIVWETVNKIIERVYYLLKTTFYVQKQFYIKNKYSLLLIKYNTCFSKVPPRERSHLSWMFPDVPRRSQTLNKIK